MVPRSPSMVPPKSMVPRNTSLRGTHGANDTWSPSLREVHRYAELTRNTSLRGTHRAADTRNPWLRGVHRYVESIVTRSTTFRGAHRFREIDLAVQPLVLCEAHRLTRHHSGQLIYCMVRATFHRPIAQCAAADLCR